MQVPDVGEVVRGDVPCDRLGVAGWRPGLVDERVEPGRLLAAANLETER